MEQISAEDRRRTARFICGGEARIVSLPSDGILVPGRVFDLSLGGCCLESAQPLPYGSRAEVLLRVRASSFRALGEVREVRNGSKICVEFLRMSSGGQDKLAELIIQLAAFHANMRRLRSDSGSKDIESVRQELERSLPRSLVRKHISLGGTHATVPEEHVVELTRERSLVCEQQEITPVDLYS